MKKSASLLVLLLFLSFVLFSLPQTNIVHAQPYVTILADGSISPESAPVQRNGDVYTLTGGMFHLSVERSNIVIDGNGMYLADDHGGGTIVYLHNVRNVMVKNFIIGRSTFGIVLDSASFITITGNIISEADISMYWEAAAIHIKGETSNIRIVGNTIKHNKWGIIIYDESPNLIIHHNNFVENIRQNLYVGSRYISSFSARWDDGKEGNYWSNYHGVDNDGNGIGDTPYQIYQNITDNYPLMEPIEPYVIPEFPSWTPLLIMLVAVIAVIVIFRRSLHKHNQGRRNQ